jgi:preprotein translocase subunit SecA
MNDQRKVVFEQRREMMAQDSLEETVANMRGNVIDDIVAAHIPRDSYAEAWDVAGLETDVREKLNLDVPVADWAKEEGIAEEEIAERLHKAADEAYAKRTELNSPALMRFAEKQVVLQVLDHFWREHLVMLDHLRQVIGWRGYAQRDPLNEYKSEAFDLFNSLINQWHEVATTQLMRVEVAYDQSEMEAQQKQVETDQATLDNINAMIAAGGLSPQALATQATNVAVSTRNPNDPDSWGHVSRNEPCPCGSGKKFKHCHGKLG